MILLIYALLGFAEAQITGISPTSCPATHVVGGPSGQDGCEITISGTGAYSVTANPCGAYWTSKTSGTAPDTLWIMSQYAGSAVGSSSCIVSIGGFNLTFNITTERQKAFQVFTNGLRIPDADLPGSSKTGSWYFYDDILTSADTRPGGTWTSPAVGSGYQDPNAGGRPKRVTDYAQVPYSSISAINKDGTLIVAGIGQGGSLPGLYSTVTGTKIWDVPASCSVTWSMITATVFYCTNDGTTTITKYTLVTPPTATSNGTVYTHSENYATGGSGDTNREDHIAIYDADLGRICAVDPINVRSWCYDLTTLPAPPSSIDFVMVSPGPSRSGRYYVWMNAVTSAQSPVRGLQLFSYAVGDSVLALDSPTGFVAPETPASSGTSTARWTGTCGSGAGQNPFCLNQNHSDVVTVGYESIRLSAGGALEVPNYTPIARGHLASKGGDARAVERGGAYLVRTTHPAEYIGCAQLASGVCVLSFYRSVSKTSLKLTNCSGSSPVTCTTESAHGWTTGQEVLVGGLQGITGVNGRRTLASGSGSTFTISVATTGTYTANTGGVTTDVAWTEENYGSNEVQACRFMTLTDASIFVHCRRLAKHRSVQYTSTYQGQSGYGDATKSGASPDGKLGYYVSNHGTPDETATYVVPTGFDIEAHTPSRHFDRHGNGVTVDVSDTELIFRVSGNQGLACAGTLSAFTDFSSPSAFTFSSVHTITGLTAGTNYWWKVVCGDHLVAADSLTTLATLAGTGSITMRINGKHPSSDDVVMEFGTTAAMGSTSDPASCPVGGQCIVTVSGLTNGALYWMRLAIRDSGDVVLSKSPVSVTFAR